MKFVNEYIEGEKLIGIELLVVNVSKGVSNAGSPYLNISLQDKTGPIEGKNGMQQQLMELLQKLEKLLN